MDVSIGAYAALETVRGLVVPGRRLHLPDCGILTPTEAKKQAEKSIPSPPIISRLTTAKSTESYLRLLLAVTLLLLAPFMDGNWATDGTGMSGNGYFRYRKDVRKMKARGNDGDAPIYEEVGEGETADVGSRGHLRWGDIVDVKEGWQRVVAIAAFPYMIIGDVRVYSPSVGERSALDDMLTWLASLGMPLKDVLADGGFNGTTTRSLIAKYGAKSTIPYPENAKRAVKLGMEQVLLDHPQIGEMFALWRDEPERFHSLYSKRAKMENVFSVIKREWPKLTSMRKHGPVNQMLMIAITLNVRRFLQLTSLAGYIPRIPDLYPSSLRL
ncbi:MAG TPA: transposase [Candidatus Sulfotelmatobacter sp.]|nr:transposase [Candidatus Sulfotelmatobacter sp.]